MAEKKRKVSSSGSGQVPKKAKGAAGAKAKPVKEDVTATALVEAPIVADTPKSASSKKPRKRAADFLDDEPEQTPPKKGKKSGKQSKTDTVSLTADGQNGVVEIAESEKVKVATSKKSKKGSMMAEAEQTQDQELAGEFGDAQNESDGEEEIDSAPALLAGFDSDNDDPAEDKDFDASRVAPIPQFKKTSKKLRQAKQKSSEGPGTVYVGRIPHGFYEAQMREYFSQFGDISRLRLSRNKKTGASKHFAFIEFENDEVAKIVAESMDNYLMFGHILKCKYAPAGSLHDDVWKGANKRYRRIPHHKLLKAQSEKPQTIEKAKKKNEKVQNKRLAQLEKAKALGYEYELPELQEPEVKMLTNGDTQGADQKSLEDKVEGVVVPPASIPKDEVAVLAEEGAEKTKKKSKKAKTETTPPAVDEETAQMAKSTAEGRRKAKKLEAEIEPEKHTEGKSDVAKVSKRKISSSTNMSKSDAKQPKSILKKSKKA